MGTEKETESARERRRRTCKTRGKDGNMPRRRGGGGGARRGRGSGGVFFSSPAKQSQAPPPSVPQQTQGGGFFSTMAQGFALGTGSAIAHAAIHGAVRSFSGDGGQGHAAPDPQQQQAGTGAAEACGAQQKAFLDCMAANNGEMTMCQYYFDAMQKCKINGDSLQY